MTRKQLTMYKALHPRADVDRLYVSQRDGGRGLLSISDVVCLEISSLTLYVQRCEEPIMSKIHGFFLLSDRSPSNLSKSAMLAVHHELWHCKSLHGQWPQLMDRLKADSFKCLHAECSS